MKIRFPEFRYAIAAGANPLKDPRVRIASDGRYSLVYAPFERVTKTARLAIVGMTPGPDQLKLAYEAVRRAIAMGSGEDEILASALDDAAFGGDLRDPLLKMLRHFGIAKILEIDDEADLWDGQSALLHATSVIPHAAFKDGAPYSGNHFREVLKSPLLRGCFETCFVPTLAIVDPVCRFIGLGRLVGEALDWCVDHSLLRPEQLLGKLPHPSLRGGSQVALFLREIAVGDLNSRNPVRDRAERLARDYDQMTARAAAWPGSAVAQREWFYHGYGTRISEELTVDVRLFSIS